MYVRVFLWMYEYVNACMQAMFVCMYSKFFDFQKSFHIETWRSVSESQLSAERRRRCRKQGYTDALEEPYAAFVLLLWDQVTNLNKM